jgi:hypothetical protein
LYDAAEGIRKAAVEIISEPSLSRTTSEPPNLEQMQPPSINTEEFIVTDVLI